MANNNRTANKATIRKAARVAAIGFAMALATGGADAAINPDPNDPDYEWHNRFDLGIDVRDVVKTPDGVRSFLATLEPETQRIIMITCDRYMERSIRLHSRDALQFCRVAVDL
jgi:hypothetical protein